MLYFNTLLKLCHFLEYFSLFSCENQMKTFCMIETVNVRNESVWNIFPENCVNVRQLKKVEIG